MSKIRIQKTLNRNGFLELAKLTQDYKKNIIEGTKNGVEKSTKILYEEVLNNCKTNDGSNWKHYDKSIICEPENGLIYTDEPVVIFNEFGTGIVGSQDFWADEFDYKVNESGKGEKGWKYYNKEFKYGGFTHGLPSRHMFFNALRDTEPIIDETISMEIKRLTGRMYNK